MSHKSYILRLSNTIIMKLQQLRYVLEVSRHNLNVSEAADALYTSQPGISKQIRLLEEELGVQIFIRSGKRVVSVSQPGKEVLKLAERILRDVQNIKNIGNEFTDHDSGSLTIATTHTQARYVLPDIVARFVQRYPKVRLSIRQGSPTAIAQMVASGEADFAIATEEIDEKQLTQAIREKKDTTPAPTPRPQKQIVGNIVEIDLHCHELLETTAGMNNKDILEYQLEIFRKTMEEYKLRKGQKIIFIHGKGDGILRQRILWELQTKYKRHHHQDASFKQYGYGATMVTIK